MRIAAQAIVCTCFAVDVQAQGELGLTVLDMTITQGGWPVTINEVPSDWPLSFSIDIVMDPISVTLPLVGCDAGSEGTFVRAYDFGTGAQLVQELVYLRDTSRVDDPMEIAFPAGGGFAEGAGPQRVLYVDDPTSLNWDKGFNAFFAERYSEVTQDTVTLTIERIEGAGWDPMTAGEPFILMVGRVGCTEFPAMPISLIAVNYGVE